MAGSKKTTRQPKSAGVKHLFDRYVSGDATQEAAFEEHLTNAEIARTICELREKYGLSQRELATRVGTSASVICRLEDADYNGHSLSMLRRIAAALDRRVEVRFVPIGRKRRHG